MRKSNLNKKKKIFLFSIITVALLLAFFIIFYAVDTVSESTVSNTILNNINLSTLITENKFETHDTVYQSGFFGKKTVYVKYTVESIRVRPFGDGIIYSGESSYAKIVFEKQDGNYIAKTVQIPRDFCYSEDYESLFPQFVRLKFKLLKNGTVFSENAKNNNDHLKILENYFRTNGKNLETGSKYSKKISYDCNVSFGSEWAMLFLSDSSNFCYMNVCSDTEYTFYGTYVINNNQLIITAQSDLYDRTGNIFVFNEEKNGYVLDLANSTFNNADDVTSLRDGMIFN